MSKKRKKKKTEWKSQLTFELIGLSLFILSIITFAKLGSVGEVVVYLFRFFIGEWHVILTIALFLTSLYIIVKRSIPSFWTRRLAGIYLLLFSFILLSHVRLFEVLATKEGFEDPSVLRNTWELFWMQVHQTAPVNDLGGGMIGALGYAATHFLFDAPGTYLISFFGMIVSILLITNQSLSDVINRVLSKAKQIFVVTFSFFEKLVRSWIDELSAKLSERKEKQKQKKEVAAEEPPEPIATPTEPVIHDFTSQAYEEEPPDLTLPLSDERTEGKESLKDKENNDQQEQMSPQPLIMSEIANEDYLLPSLELLHLPNNNGQHMEKRHISANAKKLEQTLDSFGVKAKVTEVHLGPAVTKYEVHPSVGVKVSKIVNLADDLALALAAKDIRMEAPIPGKSAIGIEVPNKEVALVTLREVLDSPKNRQEAHPLSVALGRDISGEPVLAPLNKMPHLLVAGATGSGKSVCINGIITSLLMKAKPHEVKLMMIDPKMVELNVYNGIPHLLTPVVTEPKKASQALKKVVSEMERRYDLFSHSGTRNIEGYNDLIKKQNEREDAKQPLLPYIVVIVDELADLMMVASGDVEDSITRLAQMARAAGIHMIIATQRPSVDVITGVIKANIPSRIAFGVSSQTDSRTILDSGGAEKLLGRGDMLYLPVGATKPTRVQGAFLSDDEVELVVDFVISQQRAQYQEEMTPSEEPEIVAEVDDELYQPAVDLVLEMNTASVSMLQRRFRIGYTRAARLIDEMEARGIVGPYEGSKPREVLITKSTEEASAQ
ncbi:DNA translocase FtsK [Alkalihalobacterium chitinilyticum]|uniref:DNA translocase FtsK n=1 Tax=Alkalihalobacterium chitinilyticum TaxID=2980103 RepID=A0ABT5VCL1_9BACI|nr:DNA translocase FtsK [Alkalihalobacterium chitinilyticum]MDE5412906.1 DNA translocase FtsK [Alkalihalobacterium chitinilyticum]